jgi:hypothetical protein
LLPVDGPGDVRVDVAHRVGQVFDARAVLRCDGGERVLDVIPGGPWEAAIGLSNLAPLAGVALADDQQGDGSDPGGTDNS